MLMQGSMWQLLQAAQARERIDSKAQCSCGLTVQHVQLVSLCKLLIQPRPLFTVVMRVCPKKPKWQLAQAK
jgi:hypothetical protein